MDAGPCFSIFPLFVVTLHLHVAHVVMCRCIVSPSHTQRQNKDVPGVSRDDAPRSRSTNVAGRNDTSRDGSLLPSASHGVTQHTGSRHGLGAAGAAEAVRQGEGVAAARVASPSTAGANSEVTANRRPRDDVAGVYNASPSRTHIRYL